MSKVQLQGNVSGTGVFTIASPNSNTDRTLTLPDSSGTIATTGQAVTRSQMPTGSVLQVVQSINAAGGSDYTSSTPTLRVSVSITPTASTSKFYLIYTAGDCLTSGGSSGVYGSSYFYRDSTQIQRFTAELVRGSQTWMVCAGNYLDTPSTTSAITYAVYHANASNSGTFRVGDTNQPSVLTVMEIAG
jgi:hypothetical protein